MTCLGRLIALVAVGAMCWFSAICGLTAVVNRDPGYLVFAALFALCAVAILAALMREKGVEL